ncbi:MAG: DNA glycosylase AlkZ-like family protein, partial [Solirubrobacterales bacterium]
GAAAGGYGDRASHAGFDRDRALAELARRYLGAFAPASERDFTKWSGLPLRDCRRGLEQIASDLVEVAATTPRTGPSSLPMRSSTRPRSAGAGLFALRDSKLRAPRTPLVRLLPAYDTYLMGYASRAHAVDEAGEPRILPGGGVLRPTICVDGRFVGLWSSKRSGDRLTITLEPFEAIDDDVVAAIEAEVADIGRFEGLSAALA